METKYPINIRFDEKDGDYIAVVPDLPGCSAFGDTPEEALREAETAIELWLDAAHQIGKPIPEPSVESAFSGKFNVRIPKSLHRDLALAAESEGVSLNQLVLNCITAGFTGAFRLASMAGARVVKAGGGVFHILPYERPGHPAAPELAPIGHPRPFASNKHGHERTVSRASVTGRCVTASHGERSSIRSKKAATKKAAKKRS